jgi:5-methyltetrahydropteroyltriglutamate--homocysteine methyltransferase
MRKIVDTILPTTMVGSYPRPAWFTYQLLGRDARGAFNHVDHEEANADAPPVIIQEQEEARLDNVFDGQKYYDDYKRSNGSLCWYK